MCRRVFVDLLNSCWSFSPEEAEQYLKMGTLNGLFALGRAIGFIGHRLGQKCSPLCDVVDYDWT
jgi:ATP citrate (pro-S)-lyase